MRDSTCFQKTQKSTSVEVTHRLDATLVAICSDSDFLYEIESLKQKIDATSLPIRQTVEFVVTLRSAEDPKEFLTFEAQIKDLEVRLAFCNVPEYDLILIDEQVSSLEMKERIFKAFNDYSSFKLEFSIES